MGTEILHLGAYGVTVLGAAVAVTAALTAGLGAYALLTEEGLQESVYFFFFSLAVAVWLFGFASGYASPDAGTAYRWMASAYLGVPLVPPALYTFTVHLLGLAEERRTVTGILWTAGAGFALLTVGSDVMIESVRRFSWGFYPDYTTAGLALVGYTAGGVACSLWEYWRQYRDTDRPAVRVRAGRYLVAFGIGSTALIDFLPCYGVNIVPVGFVAIFAMGLLIADTLRRYRLTELTPGFAADRILATMTDPVVVADDRGRIEVTNPGVEDVLGYSPSELEGRDLVSLFASDSTDPATQRAVLQSGTVRGMELTLEARDGTEVAATVSSSDVRDLDDRRVGTVLVARDIRERKALEEQLRHQAFHDSLTDLPNRALVEDRLQQLLRMQRRHPDRHVAVLYLDLDRFKSVNDRLGHPAGDRVLRRAAERLRGAVREEDTVGRLGGDEFAVVLADLDGDDPAAATREIIERIRRALERPFELEEEEIRISASIGVDLPEEGDSSPSDVLRRADLAMYDAKSGVGSSVAVFQPELQADADRRLRLEHEMAGALQRQQLDVHYQPIVSIDTRACVGFEALLRWHHPELGDVPPREFIPIAERTGRIVEMEAWLLGRACRQLRRWHDALSFATRPRLYVNVAEAHLRSSALIGHVESALNGAGLEPAALDLEVTERLVATETETVADVVDRVRSLGVSVSIDDFGTGTSSLARLHDLELDGLKIDRHFVQRVADDPQGRGFIDSILQLARELDLDVVAEGVEEVEDWKALEEIGVPKGQGYVWYRPASAEEMTRSLRDRTR